MQRNDFVPQTLQQAILHFSDAETCLHFVKDLRWPDGVTCPACECKIVSFLQRVRFGSAAIARNNSASNTEQSLKIARCL